MQSFIIQQSFVIQHHHQIIICCTSCFEKRKLAQRLIYRNEMIFYFTEALTLWRQRGSHYAGKYLHLGDESPPRFLFYGFVSFQMTGSCPWRSSSPTSPMASSARSRCRSFITPSTGSAQSKTLTLSVAHQCSTERPGCCHTAAGVLRMWRHLLVQPVLHWNMSLLFFFFLYLKKKTQCVCVEGRHTNNCYRLAVSVITAVIKGEWHHTGGLFGVTAEMRFPSCALCIIKTANQIQSQTAGVKLRNLMVALNGKNPGTVMYVV